MRAGGTLAQFAVKRPVATAMVWFAVAFLGLIAWFRLPQELFPSISFPQLTIVTRYPNAAPEEIENLITKVLEESVGTVPNLRRIRSVSKEGVSLVTLDFGWGTNMGFAHLAVREKIDQLKDRLPHDAEEPIIQRVNPFAQPIMVIALTGERPLLELTEVAQRAVKQRLEKVDGVAAAIISGGLEREILVEVDQGRLEASKVSLSAVVDALRNSNLNYPAGTTQGKFYEYLVRTIGEFTELSQIGQTMISVGDAARGEADDSAGLDSGGGNEGGRPGRTQRLLPLSALAAIREGEKTRTSFSRYNGKETVAISIQKQGEANTVRTASRVRHALEELTTVLPQGLHLEVVYDESTFILASIAGVRNDALLGALLAFGVLFYFLKNVRDALIVCTAIPMSIFAVFVGMAVQGISINMISLAGLGLSMGNFVDNAIVVIENIARHRHDHGRSAAEASVLGTEEVGASMIASALSIIAVFLPLLFVQGVTQQLFTDMFFITTFASAASLLVALWLVPRFTATAPAPLRSFDPSTKLRAGSAQDKFHSGEVRGAVHSIVGFLARSDTHIAALTAWYDGALLTVLGRRRTLAGVLAGLLAASAVILLVHEKVFMPKVDQRQFIMKLTMPIGARLDATDQVMHTIETRLRQTPEVQTIMANVGSNAEGSVEALGSHQGQCLVSLARGRHGRSTGAVIEGLRAAFPPETLQGGELDFVLQDSALKSAVETTAPILIEVKGPNLATLKKLAEETLTKLSAIHGIVNVKSSLALPSQETRVSLDKDRASAYQLSVADIAHTALIGIKGYVATKFKEGGREIGIRVQLRPGDRANIDTLRRLSVRSPLGIMVPLAEVAQLEAGRGASEIRHLDQQRAVVITAAVHGRGFSDTIQEAHAVLQQVPYGGDYTVTLKGESEEMRESFGGLGLALGFSLLIIYMIMAAEFESLWQPLIIMCTVPFSFVGLALTLLVTRTPLSAVVFLGVVILGGMVVNNGILLIDYMNLLRAQGKNARDAARGAARARLRPILMTMLTTILALLPLAVGLGEGSELTSPLAMTVLGGIAGSTCLTLFVVPTIYIAFEERRARETVALPGNMGYTWKKGGTR